MAFDFPNTPTIGQRYAPAGGPTYVWNGTVWTMEGTPFNGVTPSDTPPSNPVPGQMWWETDTGALFVFWIDAGGAPGQWVQVNTAAAAGGGGNVSGPASATDTGIPRFDGASGKLLKTSQAAIDDAGNIYCSAILASGLIYSGGVLAWVAQGNLKTTTNVQTTTALYLATILTGQYWGFSPVCWGNSNVVHLATFHSPQNTAAAYATQPTNFVSANNAYFSFGQGPTAGASTSYVDQRYIQASPPYDMGDGEVPLFVYALMDSAGTVIGTSVAPDPPWAYNGPTRIIPDGFRPDGTPYRRVKDVKLSKKMTPREQVIAHSEAPWIEIDIDMALKMKDAALVPHPWITADQVLAGEATPVLLDPMSPLMHELAAWHHAGHLVPDLLHKNDQPGDIKIGTTTLKRAGPPGVKIVSAGWR